MGAADAAEAADGRASTAATARRLPPNGPASEDASAACAADADAYAADAYDYAADAFTVEVEIDESSEPPSPDSHVCVVPPVSCTHAPPLTH